MGWLGGQQAECFVDLPSLEIHYQYAEPIEGSENLRYYVAITNWDQYPEALFVKAPELPPCGKNENASRTWISIHNAADDAYIYGYCAMEAMPVEIWFAGQDGQYPSVYIDVHDRKCDTHIRSNVIEIPMATLPDDEAGINDSECFADLPTLEIKYRDVEPIEGTNDFRYYLEILNWDQFPAELFVASPELPPCGKNENASRSWITIKNAANDMNIYGFCALEEMPSEIWFAGRAGQYPTVYIELQDRKCFMNYISNIIEIP
jgi:hypothetical protein